MSSERRKGEKEKAGLDVRVHVPPYWSALERRAFFVFLFIAPACERAGGQGSCDTKGVVNEKAMAGGPIRQEDGG